MTAPTAVRPPALEAASRPRPGPPATRWVKRCRLLLAAIVALPLLWPRPAASSDPPVPQRIVSLVPAVTEMLFAIGAGPRVVGVSSFDRHPPEVRSRTRVGALLDPDLERILSLRPDLVVVYGSQEDLVAQLARAGIPTYPYRHGGLTDVPATMRALGDITGLQPGAERAAAAFERAIAQVRAAMAGRRAPLTMLVFGREPGSLRNIHAAGGRGFLHDALVAAGGRNVFADADRESLPVTTEQILARAPEVVVELRASGRQWAGGATDDLSPWRRLQAVPAVRTGRIYVLWGDDLLVPGPRLPQGVEGLARLLHGT